MNKAKEEKDKFLDSLRDLGMKEDLISQISEELIENRIENAKNIMTIFRSKLLLYVHDSQDKLYSLDFMIRNLSKK